VDPKGRDFSKYAGAHTVKPNRKEAMESLDMDQTEKVRADELANRLRSHWGLENVLITLGAEGMIFAGSAGKEPVMRLPSKAREVFDVSGAGDCVAAIYTLALAAGDEVYHAMQLANVAAGVVVERWGTHPVSLAELQDALSEEDVDSHQSRNIDTSRKIMTEEQVLANVGPRLQRKVKMVFTNGCFDVLHAGHVTYLEAARALGDLLVVGVNSDASIRRIKGPKRPILEEHLRMRTLAALAAVDYVVKFSGDTPEPLIQALSPNVLVKGADWNPDSIAGADHVKSYGGLVTTVELVPGISTSEIVDRIKRQK
jgi:D-beta-D-heptose 7-phosphate kinase/D-beta-D-heptose 1-phosphate adenosyltransferase